VYGVTRQELEFSSQGMADIILVAFLFLMVVVSAYLERKELFRSDTNQQTMRDYSVMVINPPATVTDPQTYYDHFKIFGDIVLISIIPKNGSLLKDVAAKVVKEKQLRTLVQSNDGQNSVAPDWVKGLIRCVRGKGPFKALFPTQAGLKEDIAALGAKIEEKAAAIEDVSPWRVFVSFNKESECITCKQDSASAKLAGTRHRQRSSRAQ
jgi:hypothetical protein